MNQETAFQWLKRVKTELRLQLWSTERFELVSNSELKRWFTKGSVLINGSVVQADDLITFVDTCVLHPKGSRRATLV